MVNIQAYLNFNGNCKEAMQFYKDCLGGKLFLQTVGESPLVRQMDQETKNLILHAQLHNKGMVLTASDLGTNNPLKQGNNISMLLNCNSEVELQQSFQKLSRGGTIVSAVGLTHWGAIFGSLTDKYGNNWLLNYHKNN